MSWSLWMSVGLGPQSEPVDAVDPPAPRVAPSNADANSDADYTAALANVRVAMTKANEEPALGAAQLRDALSLLRPFAPALARDVEGQALRTLAQLSLARALLAADNPDGAREAMDEAIRTARGGPLPTKDFGPGLVALHRERASVLAERGHGRIEIVCHAPCRVFVNERPADPSSDGLSPGEYRVWIEGTGVEPDAAPVATIVEVRGEGGIERIEWGATTPRPAPDQPAVTAPAGKSKRLLPRWAEVTLLGVGAAGIGVGAALWAIDGRCPGSADLLSCPRLYRTKTAGIVTLAVGGAALLGGTVLLSIDEVRAGRDRRATAMSLAWSMQF